MSAEPAPPVQPVGPGPFAPDGSPVEFYLVLPPGDDPEMVRAAVPEGGSVLELGCGVGRTTRRLLEMGYGVVAVDNSPDMLAHVSGAETVLGDIESLDLRRLFDGVLLASHLVNSADPAKRAAFLSACARHVALDGAVLIQRADPHRTWEGSGVVSDERSGSVRIRIHDVARRGTIIESFAEYIDEDGGRTWIQPYTAEILDDAAFREAIWGAGLRLRRWLDASRTWADAARRLDHDEEHP